MTDIDHVKKPEPVGLRGWLILVGIGVVLGPIRLLVELVSLYAPFWDPNMISVVTDPFSESFDPLVSALFLGGFAVNVGLFLASLFLIYGYFKRKAWFPTVFVSVLLLSIVYLVADALAVGYAFPNEPVWDTATTKDLSRQIGSAIVWVPYMFLSRRVKNTFVY